MYIRRGDMHYKTSVLILYNASMKRNGQLAATYTLFTLTQIFSGGKAKNNLHLMLKLTVFMSISCLNGSLRHLVV